MSKSTPIQLPLLVEGQTVEIPLTKGYSTLVDATDTDIAQYKWHVESLAYGNAYAVRVVYPNGAKGERLRVWLHREILSRALNRVLLPDEQVDHIDGNGLNNTRENLRLATPSQNRMNVSKRRTNSSGYKGVSRHSETGKWRARITVNYAEIYLGTFDTPEAAYEAYCKAAAEYHQEFARLE